jgi:hypothetical protein
MLLAKMTMLAALLALGACAAIAPAPVATSQVPEEPAAVITAGPVGYGGRLMQPSRLP